MKIREANLIQYDYVSRVAMQYYSMINVYNEYTAKMAQNAISVELKFKLFLGGMPPDPLA